MIAALLLGLSSPMTVSGNGDDLAYFEAYYPAVVGSRIDNCLLCHTSMAGTSQNLNSYGVAFAGSGESLPPPLAAIENLDSDGDGFTNLQEIQLHTFPGNASDHPLQIFIPDALK